MIAKETIDIGTMSIHRAINVAVKNYDIPGPYLQLYKNTIEAFKEKFDDYYQKFVLDAPTLDEQWDAYVNTPSDWLRSFGYLTNFIKAKDKNGKDIELSHLMLETYQERNKVYTHTDIAEMLDNLDDYDLNHKNITQETVVQWKQSLMQNKVGSITLDW